MIRKIVAFWKETWQQSKILFIAEMIGTICGMLGAGILSFQSPHPDLFAVFTFYTVSASCFIYSNYIRHSAWLIVLMTFYFAMNLVGLVRVV